MGALWARILVLNQTAQHAELLAAAAADVVAFAVWVIAAGLAAPVFDLRRIRDKVGAISDRCLVDCASPGLGARAMGAVTLLGVAHRAKHGAIAPGQVREKREKRGKKSVQCQEGRERERRDGGRRRTHRPQAGHCNGRSSVRS